MLINCTECQISFLFRVTWFKGYKGARIRNRNCGGIIVVLNSARSLASPPKAAGPACPADNSMSPSMSGIREGSAGEDLAGDRIGQGDPSLWPFYNNDGETTEQTGFEDSGTIEERAGPPPEASVSPEIRGEAGGKEKAADGFDISERISLKPEESQTGGDEVFPLSTPLDTHPPFSEDDVYAPLVEVLPPLHGEEWPPSNSSSRFQSSYSYSPRPANKIIMDFALITVILVFRRGVRVLRGSLHPQRDRFGPGVGGRGWKKPTTN